MQSLRPNVVIMVLAALIVSLVAIYALTTLEGDALGAIVGIAGAFLAMAGSTAKELVAPAKSDAELILEYLADTGS